MGDANDNFSFNEQISGYILLIYSNRCNLHYAFRTLDYDFEIIYPTIKYVKTSGYNATDDPVVWQFSFHEMRSALVDD